MGRSASRGELVLALVSALGLTAAIAALERDTPLLMNLGAGDEAFARGFRAGWERDGVQRSGETMFRWTEDGARLEFPVVVDAERLGARLRVARFADTGAEVTLLLGARVVGHWSQPPRGWELREVELGPLQGPLMLRFRSQAGAGDAMGVALDWVEVRGATRIWPRRELWLGIAALLLGAPLLMSIVAGRAAGLCLLAVAGWGAAATIALDRLGGLVAVSAAGVPMLVTLLLLGAAAALFRRRWREQLDERRALLVPAAATTLYSLLLFHPFFYYPDVDTHARFLAAIRADPWTAFDPTEFQTRSGAWTRSIAGQRVAFPYAPFFHLAAWPLALFEGEVRGVKTLAVVSVGATLLLCFGVARAAGLGIGGAALAQVLLAQLPVETSRLTLALYPALLGQALEALLGLHLIRRFAHLDGARDAAAAALFLFAAQAAYTGSLINVGAVVSLFAALQAAAGEPRRALRLLGAYAVAAGAVILLLYARFVPTALRSVLPYAGGAAAAAGDAAAQSWQRLAGFYGVLLPALAAAGVLATRGALHAHRYLTAALGAGGGLLALRVALPTLLRDAKDVELIALPVAVLVAATLDWCWRRPGAWRCLVLAALLAVAGFCAPRLFELGASRFVAIGR
jgi:hypothetical protein